MPRRPFSLGVSLWSVVVHRIPPLTILKDWRVLVASAVVVVYSTRCYSMCSFRLLAVGIMFGAVYIYILYICIRQKGYSWSYRQWVLKNMNKTKIRVQYVLWFCSSIWGKDSLTPLKLSPFHAPHTGKWVERQDLFCTTAQHSLWIIIWLCEVSQLEITNNNDMTAEGWFKIHTSNSAHSSRALSI